MPHREHMVKTATYLLVLLATSACATDDRQREQQIAAQQAYAARVQAQCQGYGFVPGTAEFRDCVMRVDMANRQTDAQTRQMLIEQQIQRDTALLPLCSTLPPGLAGYRRAQGACR